MMRSELETFDGLDNRKDIMMLLLRLGSDRRRAMFLESLIPHSLNGFAGCPMKVCGDCRPVAAYYMLVGICNELGVSINDAARRLEAEVKRDKSRDHPLAHMQNNAGRLPYSDVIFSPLFESKVSDKVAADEVVTDTAVYRAGREGPHLK